MTIICNIFRFFGKEFLNWSFIQQRSAQNSQHFVCAPMQFKVMLNTSHHAICSDGRVYLDSYSSLSRSPKGFDFKVLFNPFKKEFHMSTIFIKKCYLCGRYLHIIGQVDKCLVLVCSIVCNTTKSYGIFFHRLITCKFYNQVRKYTICIMRKRLHDSILP